MPFGAVRPAPDCTPRRSGGCGGSRELGLANLGIVRGSCRRSATLFGACTVVPKAARAFRDAGFCGAQADAVAHTLKQSVEGELVTKAELGVATQELRTERQTLRTEMQVESQVL